MSFSLSSLGNLGGADRIVTGVDSGANQRLEPENLPVNLNHYSDLKQAELRGEFFTISDEQLVKSIEKAIKAMQGRSTSLEFSVHKETQRISVKVLDAESGEIVREIPPEKMLDFVANLWKMAGIMVDEKM